MARLNYERQKQLEPSRVEYAKCKIENLGYPIIEQSNTYLKFEYKGNVITLFPYSGWFTGKGIKDGRGINKLIKQIKQK